jgi:hypothetical protein
VTSEQAQTAVTLSALVTVGTFAYRKTVEPGLEREQLNANPSLGADYAKVFGAGPPLEWGQFLKAVGVLYIALAIMTAASPDIGGAFAILVGTGVVLTNGVAISKDLKTKPVEVKPSTTSKNVEVKG